MFLVTCVEPIFWALVSSRGLRFALGVTFLIDGFKLETFEKGPDLS